MPKLDLFKVAKDREFGYESNQTEEVPDERIISTTPNITPSNFRKKYGGSQRSQIKLHHQNKSENFLRTQNFENRFESFCQNEGDSNSPFKK